MKKLRKEDVAQEVFDLYDAYAHNQLGRREFIDKLSTYAVGGVTLMSLMSFMMPDYKTKLQVKQDDPRVKSAYINYESPNGGGTMKALLARPAEATGKLPGIVVVHENRGLNPHIEDVCVMFYSIRGLRMGGLIRSCWFRSRVKGRWYDQVAHQAS